MKFKITKRGYLEIERNGKFKKQYCPYTKNGNNKLKRCGDWCPFFHVTSHTYEALTTHFYIHIHLCKTIYNAHELGTDFIEEREKEYNELKKEVELVKKMNDAEEERCRKENEKMEKNKKKNKNPLMKFFNKRR